MLRLLAASFRCVLAAIVIGLFLSPAVTATEAAARKLFGEGVHALYQGRLWEAIENFDIAIVELPQDPRIYYFRGVAKLRTGQSNAAVFDFQRGAQLEALLGRQDIGRALQRVQGYERIQIERYRSAARRLARTGKLVAPDPVVEKPIPRPSKQQVVVSELPSDVDLPADANDPFAGDDKGLLGRGAIRKVANVAEPPQREVNAEAAADIAETGAFDAEFDADPGSENPFPVDPDLGFDQEPTGSSAATGSARSGPLGAVFRALTKSAMPATAEQRQSLVDGIRQTVPLPGAGPGRPAEPSDQTTSDDTQPSAGEDPFAMSDDADPFGGSDTEINNDADPLGGDVPSDDSNQDSADDSNDADPSPADSDPFGDDAEDPFADDQDPFSQQ